MLFIDTIYPSNFVTVLEVLFVASVFFAIDTNIAVPSLSPAVLPIVYQHKQYCKKPKK